MSENSQIHITVSQWLNSFFLCKHLGKKTNLFYELESVKHFHYYNIFDLLSFLQNLQI